MKLFLLFASALNAVAVMMSLAVGNADWLTAINGVICVWCFIASMEH